MSDPIKNFMGNIGELTVTKKTSLLFLVMVTGMLFIGSFAHLSLNRIKNNFDILYNKYTLPVIKLEELKDIYTVNILDTLRDIENREISMKDGEVVIRLAQEIIHRNWAEYEESLSIDESDWIVKTFRDWGLIPKNLKKGLPSLKEGMISRIHVRIHKIDEILMTMFTRFEQTRTADAFELMQKDLYPSIHSINIHLTQLINFSLESANLGKERNDKVYSNTFEWIVAAVIGTIVIAALFAAVILQNIRQLYGRLEGIVEEKTKELVSLNQGLERRVAYEIEESRKKDEIMYRQSRLAAMGEMIGNIAHQWRQPLNAISLLIQSFQIKQMQGKLDEAFIDAQVNEGMLLANSMSKTIDDFRNFFRPEKEKRYFDVSDNINNSLAMIRNYYIKENIELLFTCKQNYEVLGYANEFSQVVMNVLSNAKDALLKTEGKRYIEIVIEGDEKQCHIHVIDNGGGIENDVIDRMFDPYFTTKHQASGTGIGLYMSKQIIEKQMGGTIGAHNSAHTFQDILYERCAMIDIVIPAKISEKG